MLLLSADQCTSLSIEILEAAGASKEEAAAVAHHLVEASLAGVDSHGIFRIPLYVGKMLGGAYAEGLGETTYLKGMPIKPKANVRVVKSEGATAQVDGDWGFGIVAGIKAMELAIAKASEFGVGIVTGRNCDHLCRVAEYTLMAANRNMIGAMFVKTRPIVIPFGGRSRCLGNNPISFAIPAGREEPIVLDFATSVVAYGKIMHAIISGESIPEGWMLDHDGNSTTNPNDWKEGGALIPFGGHKGYAISIVNEILGGVLSGVGILSDYVGVNAFLAMALKVESLMPISEFKSKVDKLIESIRNSPKAPGVKEILIPGEPEFRNRKRRLKEGIPIPDSDWANIKKIAEKLNVKIDI
jgi:uncharacterized oxidoreductase